MNVEIEKHEVYTIHNIELNKNRSRGEPKSEATGIPTVLSRFLYSDFKKGTQHNNAPFVLQNSIRRNPVAVAETHFSQCLQKHW